MKYSFLLPAYKSAFLKEALLSLQAQSYKDFSVIISDDCSPYPLEEIVQPFLCDQRFRYRKNGINIGAGNLVRHWNLLLEECHSPFVIIAGDDDLYSPFFLEEMDKVIGEYPEANLFRCRIDKIDQEGVVTETELPFDVYEEQDSFISSLFDYSHFHSIGQYVFRTDILKKLGGFKYFPLAWFSDDATALLCSESGVAHTAKVLFHFRNSELNISSNYNNPTYSNLKREANLSFYKWYKDYLNIVQGNAHILKIADKRCRRYCCDRLMNLLPFSSKQLFTILQTFPEFIWRYVKDCINQLFLR